jgi:hypothetical protein
VKHTKRCGTKRGEHMKTVYVIDGGTQRCMTMLWDTCATCGVWLPIGSSDETEVAVEVRAARLAQEDGWQEASTAEVHGWNDRLDEVVVEAEGGTWTADPRDEDEEDWHAGYFAHAIANHDDEQEADAARAVAREVRDSIEPNGVRLKGQR